MKLPSPEDSRFSEREQDILLFAYLLLGACALLAFFALAIWFPILFLIPPLVAVGYIVRLARQ